MDSSHLNVEVHIFTNISMNYSVLLLRHRVYLVTEGDRATSSLARSPEYIRFLRIVPLLAVESALLQVNRPSCRINKLDRMQNREIIFDNCILLLLFD